MEIQQSTSDPSQAVDLTLAEEGYGAEEPTTIGRLLQKAVAIFPNRLALRFKETGTWKELTYLQYYSYCIQVAKAYVEVNYSKVRKYLL